MLKKTKLCSSGVFTSNKFPSSKCLLVKEKEGAGKEWERARLKSRSKSPRWAVAPLAQISGLSGTLGGSSHLLGPRVFRVSVGIMTISAGPGIQSQSGHELSLHHPLPPALPPTPTPAKLLTRIVPTQASGPAHQLPGTARLPPPHSPPVIAVPEVVSNDHVAKPMLFTRQLQSVSGSRCGARSPRPAWSAAALGPGQQPVLPGTCGL